MSFIVRSMQSLVLLTAILGLLLPSHAHEGHHDQAPIGTEEGGDWSTRHMVSEHHISTFDSASFFSMHDYSSMSRWDADDILKTYGLKDASTKHVTQDQRTRVVESVLNIYDMNHDGVVSQEEFTSQFDRGNRLPDFGFGPGHHGDDEYEYEIHHYEKYHDENTKEEDLTHPEDIEHFRHHDEMDRLEEELERRERINHGVDPGNIPNKFKRPG